MATIRGDLKIFCGNSNKPFAEKACKELNTSLGSIKVKKFSDGETQVEIGENVRGKDVFIIQPTSYPANDHIMELLLIIDAIRGASARRITAVIPYYGYARQDKKVAPRVPISAKVIAEMIKVAGAKRVLAMDLHASQIQGFFGIPADNLYAKPVLIKHITDTILNKNSIMVSPDAGGVERTRSYAKALDLDLAIIDKRREKANVAEAMNVIGNVRGKEAILLDDMVDTAGTLCTAADILIAFGATKVYAVSSHAVLSGPAISRINKSKITSLFVTDTIPLNGKAKKCKKIKVLSVAPLFGKAIGCIHNDESVSQLFK
ncbi:ribose-phosphate pyrophosphokinase [Candidatus Parcubacteria bacterium]|nr:ribose-phosphate pyrophosphokinase [Candidatus Parcubacteria bacterium]